MRGLSELHGNEFVGHVFVAADGPQPEADRCYLLDLWHRCCDQFAITEGIDELALNPSIDRARPCGCGDIVAARTNSGPGKHQAVLRLVHDVFCFGVLRAPAPDDGLDWCELDAQWSAVLGQPTAGVIGSVRILQARLVDPLASPTADPAQAAAVRGAWPCHDSARNWWAGGTVHRTALYGRFAVWEASDPPNLPRSWDGRGDRRLVVLAAADHEAELSAWTWSRGSYEMTPLTHYLLQAAKLRYEHRVWEAEHRSKQLRRDSDQTVGELLVVVREAAEAQREPHLAALVAASARLVRLQADELGLVHRATRLREMQRTVNIAATNLAAFAPLGRPSGPFAEDMVLASWLGSQLDHDATYLEAARDRAREVAALIDQLVQRGQRNRQERFDLGLTGALGAILMILAAIQAFQYVVPIPRSVQPSVITALGIIALLASLVVLRLAIPGRRWPLVLVQAGTGLLAGAAVWIGMASLAAAGRSTSPAVTLIVITAGAVSGIGIAVLATALHRRSNAARPGGGKRK